MHQQRNFQLVLPHNNSTAQHHFCKHLFTFTLLDCCHPVNTPTHRDPSTDRRTNEQNERERELKVQHFSFKFNHSAATHKHLNGTHQDGMGKRSDDRAHVLHLFLTYFSNTSFWFQKMQLKKKNTPILFFFLVPFRFHLNESKKSACFVVCQFSWYIEAYVLVLRECVCVCLYVLSSVGLVCLLNFRNRIVWCYLRHNKPLAMQHFYRIHPQPHMWASASDL